VELTTGLSGSVRTVKGVNNIVMELRNVSFSQQLYKPCKIGWRWLDAVRDSYICVSACSSDTEVGSTGCKSSNDLSPAHRRFRARLAKAPTTAGSALVQQAGSS
jgi:hypothetical protein